MSSRNLFKSKTNQKTNQKKDIQIDINDKELFPELIHHHQEDNKSTITSFKDVLNQKDIDQPNEYSEIKEGQVEIFIDDNGNTIYNYGKCKNKDDEKIKDNEKIKEKDDPNYIMKQIIIALNNNFNKYANIYDSTHGEGAFDEKFASVIYYDFEEDEEEDTEEEENNNN
jgi:hypothetical protein